MEIVLVFVLGDVERGKGGISFWVCVRKTDCKCYYKKILTGLSCFLLLHIPV